jgi:hypothetical protein
MRRTPLVAGGFLAGALIGALPPLQAWAGRWHCTTNGGQWRAAIQACEYRDARDRLPPGTARELPARERLLHEEDHMMLHEGDR